MHNYKIDKSLDFLQKAVSNNSPLFKDIAFTFEGKKQYDIYKRKLELAFPGRDVDFHEDDVSLLWDPRHDAPRPEIVSAVSLKKKVFL